MQDSEPNETAENARNVYDKPNDRGKRLSCVTPPARLQDACDLQGEIVVR